MARTRAIPLTLSDSDYQRLASLVENQPSSLSDSLEAEISRAKIVPGHRLPADVVSMHSTVTFLEVNSNSRRTVTLVYPQETDVARMRISVLTPVGVALIGMKAGETISWRLDNGKMLQLQVLEIRQQKVSPA